MDGCLTRICLFLGEGSHYGCDADSPVNKSADDPDGHQQLNQQDQVHLPYEACSVRRKDRVREDRLEKVERWEKKTTATERVEAARQVGLFVRRTVSKCLRFWQTCVPSSHLK